MNKITEFTKTIKGRTTILIFSFLSIMVAFSVYVFIQANEIRREYINYKSRLHALQIGVLADAMNTNSTQLTVYRSIYLGKEELEQVVRREAQDLENAKTKVRKSYTNYLDTLGITAEFKDDLEFAEKNSILLTERKFQALKRVKALVDSGVDLNGIKADSILNKVNIPEFEKAISMFWSGYFGKFIREFEIKAEGTAYRLNIRIQRFVITVVVITILLAIIYFLLWNYFIKSLSISIDKPVKLLNQLALGELPNEVSKTSDELSDIIVSSNKLSANLRNASNFTIEIGKGNFNHDFEPLSEKDVLGNALLAMKNDLETYSIKEKQLNWANVGQTKFAEILRNTDRELSVLCDELIKELVKYLKANQGGIYIFNETSKNLNLISCYAFERKKFVNKEIELGEGLLGQCYLEADKIYLTQVPAEYITITSGLGGAAPKCLLLVPIKSNEQVVGVVELASFREFQNYEMEFLEKICENIASMISTIMRNNLTQKLLKETTFASECLRAQEEEMRQNLEELHATQEEMQRKERQYLDEIENLKELLGNADRN